MDRNELLEVAFILDEIIKKRKIIRYTYQDKTLIVWFSTERKEAYKIGG